MGYTVATLRSLVERDVEVHVVRRDRMNQTPYQCPILTGIYMYNRSEMTVDAMHTLTEKLSPSITVVSGWVDKGYLAVAQQLRAKGKIVVTGLDGQWHGTLRQKLASWLGRMGYFSRYFSHAWVAGLYQYEYARKLGFRKKQIISDLYSADLNLYHHVYQQNFNTKRMKYPHRFLFVGRLEAVKGLDILLKAWQLLGDDKRDWKLHLIGNGSLKDSLNSMSDIVIKDFMQPNRLVEEVAKTGCFVLPSLWEPWGVVVHEFAAAGLPLITSDIVGAANTFLISRLNGFSFTTNDPQSLSERMFEIISLPDWKLFEMSIYSHRLSHRITPESSTANLLSLSRV